MELHIRFIIKLFANGLFYNYTINFYIALLNI